MSELFRNILILNFSQTESISNVSFAHVIDVMLTCPGFFQVVDVVILSELLIEWLWLSKSEAKLILGPFGEIILITKKMVVQETHQAAGVLPYFTTQLLESQVVSTNVMWHEGEKFPKTTRFTSRN